MRRIARFCAALAVAVAGSIQAWATPRATGGGYELDSSGGDNACAELLSAERNILWGVQPTVELASFSYNGGNYYETQTTDWGCLTDGKIPKVAGGAERTDARALIPNGSKLTWELGCSVALESVRIYTQWPDGYRNDVSVEAIEVRVNDEWQTLENSSFSYARRESRNEVDVYEHDLTNRRVVFEDPDDAVLANGVDAIRITFGDQSPVDGYGDGDTICYGCYWEVEATEVESGFKVRNTVNSSTVYTGIGEVVPKIFPEVEGYSEYQITVGANEPAADGWKAFVSGVAPTDVITFDLPQQLDAVTTFTLHLRGEGVEAKTYTAQIKSAFGAVPSFSVNGTITRCLPNAVDGALVKGADIVSKVKASDSHGGILSVTAEDQYVTAENATVSFTVRNLAGETAGSMTVTTIPYTGLFDDNSGYLTRMLHLGADFNTDDLTHGGINDDRLAEYFGEAYQLPRPGLVYTGLATNGNEPLGQLTWTPTVAENYTEVAKTWIPRPNRDYYVKYWFVYVYCPEDRIVRLCSYYDDDVRVWINGELKVALDGCGQSKKTDGVQLRKGLNAVLMKLREGGGDDYVGLSIRPDPAVDYGRTWAGDNHFGDLRYQFCPDFQIADAVSGHPYITTSGRVKVRYMPKFNGYTKYQIVPDGTEPASDGWNAYDPQAIPEETFAYEGIANNGSVSMTVHLSDENGAATTNFTASLTYRSDITGPTLNLKDISVVQLRPGAPVTVNAKLFDNGTADGVIFSCEPESVTQSGEVTVTVIGRDGGVSSETRNVTVVPGYGPLPSESPYYLKVLLHLGADFINDHAGNAGIDEDLLNDFGGEANQRPYEGLVTKGLVWTAMYDPDGQWSPNRDAYNKYWHVYISVPGTEDRTVCFYTRQDDDVRIWRDGELIVDSIGWDNNGEKGPFRATLHGGQNSLTIRLREGDGGDNMAVRLADENGQPLNDLTFSLEPLEFGVKCVQSGSEEFTAVGEVGVSVLPFSRTAESYQLSVSGDPALLADDGWVAYPSSRATAATLDFGEVADGQTLTGYCFLKEPDGTIVKYESYNTLTVSTETPTVNVRTAAFDIDSEKGYRINPNDLNDGSLGGASGIAKMWTDPAVIYGPGEVTLYVMNAAGLVASAVVAVTLDSSTDRWVSGSGSDETGNGTEENPYRTIKRVLESAGTSLSRINLKPGTYNPAAGEVFPIQLPDNVTLVGHPTDGAEDVIVDAGDSASHVLKAENGVSVGARHVQLCNSTDAIVRATGDNTRIALENCALVQTAENKSAGGALSVASQAVIEATACCMNGMRRNSVIYYSNAATVLLTDCEVADNDLGHSTVHAGDGWGGTFRATGCDFLRNKVQDGVPHDAPYAFFGYFCRIHLTVDRCRFIGNSGGCFMGLNYTATEGNTEYEIRNSFIADNRVYWSLYCGYQGAMRSRNCTYVGNGGGNGGGGYSMRAVTHHLYNCILANEGPLSRDPGWGGWGANASGLILVDTDVYNCQPGEGYNLADSSNVSTFDPLFRDAANGDYTLLPYSPAIDAGNNGNVAGEFDLAGNARVANNSDAAEAKVDLGCHESLFHAATEPIFIVPVPGKMSCYRGVSYTIPVSIAPAVTEEVVASVTLGEGLSSEQTELVFNEANGWTADLSIAVSSSDAVEHSRITFTDIASEPLVKSEIFDIDFGDLVLSVGGQTLFYIRTGETVNVPVQLALDGAVAPGEVPFVVQPMTGSGSNAAAWSDESMVIPEGEHAAAGHLVLTGGLDVNTVTFSCGAMFAETEAASVSITVVGYPGYFYVDSANGVDAIGRGTLEAPFRTIGFAKSFAQDGDTIRLLPGTYSPATETLPLLLGKVNLKGMGTAPENVVFTGTDGATVASGLVKLVAGDSIQVENMVLRDTSGPLFDLDGATLVLSDVRATQTTADNGVAGAARMMNNSVLTATNSSFTGIVRKAVVYLQTDARNENRINLTNCRFADNLSDYATLSSEQSSGGGIWRVEGCDFVNNRVTESANALSDACRSTVLFGRVGANAEFNRCRFLGNAEGNVIGVSGGSTVTIANTLIAGNYAPGNLFRSYNSKWELRNCTFAGNYGGVWCQLGAQGMNLYNCIFAGNSALVQHTADNANQYPQDANYRNCLVYDTPIIVGEFADGRYPKFYDATNVQTDGPTYTADPMLRKPLKWTGEASAAGRPSVNWATYSAQLINGSPALNVGNKEWCYGELDLLGNARLQDKGEFAENPRLDLGAYEGSAKMSFIILIK